MKIYTRKGDRGETSLFGGRRVPKSHARVEAYGTVDELNSALGLVIAHLSAETAEWHEALSRVQADCFTIGALLATPGTAEERPRHIPEIAARRVADLEGWIDRLDRELEPLRAFVLPGGAPVAAHLHHARGVCRRAERRIVALGADEPVEPLVLQYLNRLGDLLFVLARAANRRHGVPDREWRPRSHEGGADAVGGDETPGADDRGEGGDAPAGRGDGDG